MYITRALIGRNPCLDQVIQTRKTIVLFYRVFEDYRVVLSCCSIVLLKTIVLFYRVVEDYRVVELFYRVVEDYRVVLSCC